MTTPCAFNIRHLSRWYLAALCLALAAAPAWSAEAEAQDAGQEKVVARGGVRYFPNAKRVEVDGKICMKEGPIELLACAKGGKEYESVITLDVNPEVLHFFLLMMGLKPGDTGPKFQGDPENAPTGSPVIIEVQWKENDKVQRVRGEDLCWNTIDRRPMERTHWVFVGSRMVEDQETGKKMLWVKREKSIITVYRDPYSLIDLPLALGANDEAYVANKDAVPDVGTDVTVIITPATVPPVPANDAGGRVVLLDVTGGGRLLLDHHDQQDFTEALRNRLADRPKDSYEMTLDHLAPAKAVAAAFNAVAETKAPLNSVKTVRIQPNVIDRLTLAVGDDGITINGQPLTDQRVLAAKELARELAKDGKQTAGVSIRVKDAGLLKEVAKAAAIFEGIEDLPLRILWPADKP
jgi:hypothetical protein